MSIQVFVLSGEDLPCDIVVQVQPTGDELGNYQLRFAAEESEVLAGQSLLLLLRLPASYNAASPSPGQALASSTHDELTNRARFNRMATEQHYSVVNPKPAAEALRQAPWPLPTAVAGLPEAIPTQATQELHHLLTHLLSVARELPQASILPLAAGQALRAEAGPGQRLPRVPVPATPPASNGAATPLLASDGPHECWLRRFYALLDAHLDKSDLSVEWLALQLHMSRKTLLRKLQRLLHLSPRDVVQQYRLRRGAELLRAGYPVAETAYAVGFNTPAYFGLCFKEFYHVTPRQFAGGK